uniref:Uncharacterized protein n=1 Tax=Arion vulgaris TaxID=1028688 RepID=A0A0B7B5B1_9EUPU
MLISISPGNEINMIASLDSSAYLSGKPIMIPSVTPATVNTNIRFCKHHFGVSDRQERQHDSTPPVALLNTLGVLLSFTSDSIADSAA